MQRRENIILVGFMGSGKSSIGKRIAKRLGFQFIDTDQIVIDRAGMPISEIFARRGEDAFRDMESSAWGVKEQLLALAQTLGFDLCKVAPCVAPPHGGEFHAWLAAGRAGEMAWLERNKDRRTDPQLVLAGAQSVVTLAMNYWQGEAAR